tara:strand:- start:399 stop:530 length:132 start_codon:yes stop_codon:yes gene_type:complete
MKKLTERKKRNLKKWLEWRLKQGVKNKGRAKHPVMTKNHGRII